MNMLLRGVENRDIRYRDSLAGADYGDDEKYALVLANPPFAGSLDYKSTSKSLLAIVKTKKSELLFIALFLRLLQTGAVLPSSYRTACSSAQPRLTRPCAGSTVKESTILVRAAIEAALDHHIRLPRRSTHPALPWQGRLKFLCGQPPGTTEARAEMANQPRWNSTTTRRGRTPHQRKLL